MCCQLCAKDHVGHTKAFFKDTYIESNFSNVKQTPIETLQQLGTVNRTSNMFFSNDTDPEEPLPPHQMDTFQPNFEIYVANQTFDKERV